MSCVDSTCPPPPSQKKIILDFMSARSKDIHSALTDIESYCDSLSADISSLINSYGIAQQDRINILSKLQYVKESGIIAKHHLSNISYYLPKQ